MSIEITPDELCPHVEAGEAERVGGVHFATVTPPISIGMCQRCLEWCTENFERPVPLNDDARSMLDDRIINAEYLDVPSDSPMQGDLDNAPVWGSRNHSTLVEAGCGDIQGDQTMTEKERILCAAIHFDDGKEYVYQPPNIERGFVLCGLRHGNCFGPLTVFGNRSADHAERPQVQGFLTSNGRFVDRKEAWLIAVREGQVVDEPTKNGILVSEDLY